MESKLTLHLREPNTLSRYLCPMKRLMVESLKITGVLGQKDFNVLDTMCSIMGYYDDDDNFISFDEDNPALRHLDLGEAVFVEGDELPCFGYQTLLESCVLPRGIKTTLEDSEWETGLCESESLKTLVLPEGLKIVGGFCACPNLTDLVLPEGLVEIEDRAFCGCEGITHLHIPKSVESLLGSSFAGCRIKAYDVDKENPYLTSVDGVIYTKDLSKLVAFPSDYPCKEYVVPETTKIIGYGAFLFSKIEHVELPLSLVTIESEAFCDSNIVSIDVPRRVRKIGYRAFACCQNLRLVTISDRRDIPDDMFEGCKRPLLRIKTIAYKK